ncbi:MAG: hypothetical protein ABIU84_08045, partial [Thermoanaerobaculia bacterium]
ARHDDNALVVPPADEQALATAILRLVEDRPLRERLAQSGLATARGFTWQRSAEAFVAFLRRLPEPAPVAPAARAALELFWQSRGRDKETIAALENELGAVLETLATIRKSTFWKAAQPYWRWKARLLRGAAWVALAGALGACSLSSPAPSAAKGVVLVSIDTLRPDHPGCYGYAPPSSPEIDRLCREDGGGDQPTLTLDSHTEQSLRSLDLL